jgi:hypothetical protein
MWTRLLLQEGHPVFVFDQDYRTPLMYAAAYGQTETAILLLEGCGDDSTMIQYAALLGYINDAGMDFLDFALHCYHFEFVLELTTFFQTRKLFGLAQDFVDRALMDYCHKDASSSKIEDARGNFAEVVQRLLELGARTDCFHVNGENLLHLGNIPIPQALPLLMNHQACHLNVGSATGQTPAMKAASRYNPGLLNSLLGLGGHQ